MTYHNELFIIGMEACRLHAEENITQQGLKERLNTTIDIIVDAIAELLYAEEIGDSDVPTCIYSKVYDEVSGQ